MYPKPIQQLIYAFTRLPSIGSRSAERFVFHLLKSGKKDAGELAIALKQLIDAVKSCPICWDFSDQTPCAICKDAKRDKTLLCIVQEPQDIRAMERAGYAGLYHCLRGTYTDFSDDPERVKFDALFSRLADSPITEILLALNPTMDGETTAMFIEQTIKEQQPRIRITRLARGIPIGGDIQYADDMTLQNALKHRREE